MSHMTEGLLKKPRDQLTADETRAIVEIYKMLVDKADNVSQRRQNCNNFYLSVNTALVGASAYISAAAHRRCEHRDHISCWVSCLPALGTQYSEL